jgi:N-acetylglutamate synthase-like GNAT family acetyltransferase
VAGSLAALRDAVVKSQNAMNRGGFVTALERGIDVFVLCRPPESAVTVAGAATRGPLRSMRMVAVHERGRRRALQDRLREQLGADAYDSAIERGAAMSYEEALDYVHAELDAALSEFEVGDA